MLCRPCAKPSSQIWNPVSRLDNNWEIERDEIEIKHELHQSKSIVVHFGKFRSNIEVAVKTLAEGSKSANAFMEEAENMKKLRHKHLVSLFGVCTSKEPILMIHEYMAKGNLLDFLRNSEKKSLEFEDLIKIASEIACGMEYLESQHVIHGDLAAKNVLISENNIAKIGSEFKQNIIFEF